MLTFSVAVRRSSCGGDGEGVACSSMDLQKSAANLGRRQIEASYCTKDSNLRDQQVGPEHRQGSRAEKEEIIVGRIGRKEGR